MNEAVVRRLGRLDLIYGLSALAVLLTGLGAHLFGHEGQCLVLGQPPGCTPSWRCWW
jgi:putative membrane protein